MHAIKINIQLLVISHQLISSPEQRHQRQRDHMQSTWKGAPNSPSSNTVSHCNNTAKSLFIEKSRKKMFMKDIWPSTRQLYTVTNHICTAL